MEILIDTQILIWFQLNHPNLGKTASELIIDPNNTIYVSDISLYEIAIKKTIGKLADFDVDIQDIITIGQDDGFNFITLDHDAITTYTDVPFHEWHRDPFDRLIIAIAKSNNLTLLSADEKFELYKDYVRLIRI
uniref:PilT protein domain protein n=1 Tax=Sphingobacterium sp. (strain 21) TaxID=743722 RepID=F4C2M0_SPHS2